MLSTRVPRPTAPVWMSLAYQAQRMSELTDAISGIAEHMDDPDRIAEIRVGEILFRAELDIAARPIDPRRLN